MAVEYPATRVSYGWGASSPGRMTGSAHGHQLAVLGDPLAGGRRDARARRRPGFLVLVLSQYVEQLYARELLARGEGAVG